MEYTKLGRSGLDVSRLCLGTMSFGRPESGMFPWAINADQSEKIVQTALNVGINFFDTANVYSYGDSEEFLGRALANNAKRDEIVIASKVFFAKGDQPNQIGLSRKAIMKNIDQTLKRLKTDYLDLYIIHRWDYHTPIEETMAALNDLVKAGKVRYLGASAMYSWQFQQAQDVAEQHGWTKFISMQDHLNLLYREEEREMLPLCASENIGVTPYSPLASGRLSRNWTSNSKRSLTDVNAKRKYDSTEEQDQVIVDRVGEVAKKYEVSRTQVALAWLLQKPTVTAPIIGATKVTHLQDAIKAIDLKLTSTDVAYLEELYQPHKLVGALTQNNTALTR